MVEGARIAGPIALIGANGMLARMVQQRAPQGLELYGYDLPDFDLTDRSLVTRVLAELKPRIIINCAAFTAVDDCEVQEALATSVNADGVAILADIAHDLDATLVHISTDYVFPGTQSRLYSEEDPTGPVSAYGRSKLKGEQAIFESSLEKYFIIRTSWLYGPDGPNFVETILRLAGEREELRIVSDQIGSPTFAGDLSDAIFKLLVLPTNPQSPAPSPFGIYHFADEGQCSWHEFALQIVALAGQHGIALKVNKLLPIKTEEYPLPASRPAYSVFDKKKYKQATGAVIPFWQDSLKEYFTLRSHKRCSEGA
jgi:dTDP-4-dehydrorhamnose reductase